MEAVMAVRDRPWKLSLANKMTACNPACIVVVVHAEHKRSAFGGKTIVVARASLYLVGWHLLDIIAPSTAQFNGGFHSLHTSVHW